MRRYLIILIACIIFSCAPLNKYRNLPEVKVWEPEIEKFEQLDRTEKYPGDAILFAGSSSIRLWESIEKDMIPSHVIQRGYGGAKLSDFSVYASRIINSHPCRAIVIFVANDITGTEQDKTPEEVAALFKNVLKTIRKSHPVTPVFWIEITPTASRWKVWPEIQQANSLIKDLCSREKNSYFIETQKYFLNEKGLPSDDLFREDKLHLSDKGYEIWKGIIKQKLDEVLGK
jgi:hypothetical protein